MELGQEREWGQSHKMTFTSTIINFDSEECDYCYKCNHIWEEVGKIYIGFSDGSSPLDLSKGKHSLHSTKYKCLVCGEEKIEGDVNETIF